MYQPTLTHPQEFLSLLTSSNVYCGSADASPPIAPSAPMYEPDFSPHEPSTRSPTPAPSQHQHQHPFSAAQAASLSCCWPMASGPSTDGALMSGTATTSDAAAAVTAVDHAAGQQGMFSMDPSYTTGFGQDLFSMPMYLPDDSTASNSSSGGAGTSTTTTSTTTETAYLNDLYYRRQSMDMYHQQYRPQTAMTVPLTGPGPLYHHRSAHAALQDQPEFAAAADLKRSRPDASPPLATSANKRSRKLAADPPFHHHHHHQRTDDEQQHATLHQYDSTPTPSTATASSATVAAAGSHSLRQSPPGATPRRQKLRYDGDEYTPKWVRYTGQLKEGYCDHCKPGKWLQLKNSAYWYHKQFFHGISSVSGKRFAEPLERRAGEHDVIEGLCHQCRQFVPICNAKRKTSVLWYRHAHKCHIYDKPKSRLAAAKRGPLKK